MVIHRIIPRRRFLGHLTAGGLITLPVINGLTPTPARATQRFRPANASTDGVGPLIVIDPGHGGHDPGTKGKSGTLEKDVTLATAVALKNSLMALGFFDVVMTRARDQHLLLEDRIGIARELGASLMVSLHANAFPDPSVRGASVYTLASQASDREAEAVARFENRPVAEPPAPRPGLSPGVSGILDSLAERETRAASARLAHRLAAGLSQDVPMMPKPERQADFTVLHTPEVPSVLVEMGFLSNPLEEAALNDRDHQATIARAITVAVAGWFSGKDSA
jgi:N-acetylmuramoyl-L-alanine amidase